MAAVAIQEIVELVGGRYTGPADRFISGVATLADAHDDQISFLSNLRYAPQLATTRAGAILVASDVQGDDARYIRVANPYLAWARVIERWFVPRPPLTGISPQASISPSARLGANVAVGAFTTIGDEVAVGDDTIIYSNVAIYPGSIIGSRCIIHSGTVIGADGYGFVVENGRHRKVPQIGIVRIGDDVEIGAGCTIDRASITARRWASIACSWRRSALPARPSSATTWSWPASPASPDISRSATARRSLPRARCSTTCRPTPR